RVNGYSWCLPRRGTKPKRQLVDWRSRSGLNVGRHPPAPDCCLTLCWIPCVSFSTLSKEIHHGSASRSDGTGPQTQRRQSRHHSQLPPLLSQVRCVLYAFARRTRRRRNPCLFAAPDRSRTTGLCQLSPGVCCPQVPL